MNFKTRTTYDSLYTLLNYVGTFLHEYSYILVEIYLDGFYKGDQGLESQVKKRDGDIDPGVSRTIELEGLNCSKRLLPVPS